MSFGFRLSESSLSKTKTVKDMDLHTQQPLWFLKELIASKSPGLWGSGPYSTTDSTEAVGRYGGSFEALSP